MDSQDFKNCGFYLKPLPEAFASLMGPTLPGFISKAP
jgi:hypothetical protein